MTRFPLALLTLLAVGCARSDQATTDSASGETTPDSAAMGGAPAADSAPDRRFLAMMIDHHEGMVQMAEPAMSKATKPATQSDAHMLHTKQAAERDTMKAMLRAMYNDDHAPMLMPGNQAMIDSINAKSGAAYDREFYRQTIKHHQEGIQMIDRFLPQLTDAKLRAMAEKMRTDQQKEVAEFQKKAGGT